jgi:hypothetical protein
MSLVLRTVRRRTAWESPDVDQLINVEFKVDGVVELQASVFKIDLADLTRVVAEYSASAELGLRATSDGVDLAHDDYTPVPTPGDCFFEFTRNAHHEFRFADETALRAFLADHVLPSLATRYLTVPKAAIRAYVKQRRDENDAEWSRYDEERGAWPTK